MCANTYQPLEGRDSPSDGINKIKGDTKMEINGCKIEEKENGAYYTVWIGDKGFNVVYSLEAAIKYCKSITDADKRRMGV